MDPISTSEGNASDRLSAEGGGLQVLKGGGCRSGTVIDFLSNAAGSIKEGQQTNLLPFCHAWSAWMPGLRLEAQHQIIQVNRQLRQFGTGDQGLPGAFTALHGQVTNADQASVDIARDMRLLL